MRKDGSKLLFTGRRGDPYTFLKENQPRLKNVKITQIRGRSGGFWEIFGKVLR